MWAALQASCCTPLGIQKLAVAACSSAAQPQPLLRPLANSATTQSHTRFVDLYTKAPDRARACRPSPEWQLKRRVTDPMLHPSPKPLPPPPLELVRPGGPTQCNSYMPPGRGLDRFLWTIQVCVDPLYLLYIYRV